MMGMKERIRSLGIRNLAKGKRGLPVGAVVGPHGEGVGVVAVEDQVMEGITRLATALGKIKLVTKHVPEATIER